MIMSKSKTGLLWICAGLLAAAPAFAADESTAAAGAVSIPQLRVDMRVRTLVMQGQPDTAELRKAVQDDLVNRELMARQAVLDGLNRDTEIVQQIEFSKQSVLVEAFAQDYIKKHPISESQISGEYEQLKARLGSKEYHARQILVASESEALAIVARLDKKAKFETLASEKSQDKASAEHGGDLGWLLPNNLAPAIAQALVGMKKGEITREAIHSSFGWHVIKLDDIRDFKMPSYESLKPQLLQHLQQQAIGKAVEALRARAKIG